MVRVLLRPHRRKFIYPIRFCQLVAKIITLRTIAYGEEVCAPKDERESNAMPMLKKYASNSSLCMSALREAADSGCLSGISGN